MNDSASDNNLSTVPYDSPDGSVLQTAMLDERNCPTNGLLLAPDESNLCERPDDELSTLPYDQPACFLVDEQCSDGNDWALSTLPYDDLDETSHIKNKIFLEKGKTINRATFFTINK